MPRLSRQQEVTRRLVIQIAADGGLPGPLAIKLLRALQQAIPCDGQRLFGVDPGTFLLNRMLAASDGDDAFRLRWLQDIYLAYDGIPYYELPDLFGSGAITVIYREQQESCWGIPRTLLDRVPSTEHTRVFHDTLTPVGGSMRTCFTTGGRVIAMLDMVRRGAGRPLQPTDAAFVRLLAPTISSALAAAFARERALFPEATDNAPDASGIVLLNPDGRIRFVTPAGEAWLRLMHDGSSNGSGGLPTAVASALAAFRAGSAADSAVTHSLVAPTPSGPVRVEASAGGDDGCLAIVLTPVQKPGPPEVPLHWPLTRQERQVVSLLVGGLSNRQIANRLYVGEHTIETHLGHAYEKLGVRGRTQLLARLFQETFLQEFQRSHTSDDAIATN